MSQLEPLRFHPIFRRYLWGGRRLETLGKQLPSGNDYAESWEIVDRGNDQSIVACGPLAGATLGELVRSRGAELLGRHAPATQFPLLFKFLDAQQRLSIQVHPDDARAGRLVPPDRGKTEAWVILDAASGSYLYAGLRDGMNRETLRQEVERHTCELCVQRFEPQPGDCFFLPAGIVHALGAGLLVAEIQQSSDTTYRLYDWGRLGPDGQPRPLHIEAGLEAVDFHPRAGGLQAPTPTDEAGIERLVECDSFVLDRWQLSGTRRTAADDRCHLLVVLEGKLNVERDPAKVPLGRGDVLLVPASASSLSASAEPFATVLDIYLP